MNARAALVTSRPGAVLYARALAELPPTVVGLEARLSELAIFPVKGLGAVRLLSARVDHRGLVDPASGLADRGVMLAVRQPGARPDGVAYDALGLANRNEATLALARAFLEDSALVYDARGLVPLRLAPASLAPASEGERIRVKLPYTGGPVIEGIVDEGPLATWVRDLLRAHPAQRRYDVRDVVAVRAADDHRRSVAERHLAGQDAQTLFGDGAHALVASASTLTWMNDVLVAEGQRAIAMEAFRPNIVLEGLPPNAEDVIGEAHIDAEGGLVRLVFSSLCVRCDATRVDYTTGARADSQPLAWLARNRPPRDADANAATFAINAVFPRTAHARILRLNDDVRIVSERVWWHSRLMNRTMKTVYDAAGGLDGLLKLASAWHTRVLEDEVVSHAFSHGYHPQHTERLASYWAEALGGPTTYSDRYGDETSVVRIHSGNGLHEEMDQRAIACFDQALDDVGLAHDERLRRVLHDYFAWATTTTMARYHHSAEDVPDGFQIPKWSWHGLVSGGETAHRGGPLMDAVALVLEHSVEADVSRAFAWKFRTNVATWNDPPATFVRDGAFTDGSQGSTVLPGQTPLTWWIRDVHEERSFAIEMLLDRATLRFEWYFDVVGGGGTKLTQRIVLSGTNAPAYREQVETGFRPTLADGMRRLAADMVAAQRGSKDAG